MKTFILILVGIAIFTFGAGPAKAGGGDVVGNGGDVYMCGDGARRGASMELLDFYEGREMRGLTIDLGEKALDPLAKVRLALTRLQRLDPERAEQFRRRADGFFQDLLLVKGNLTQIPDYGYIVIEEGCAVRQIARQRQPQFPEDKTFWISRSLWENSLLDNDSRAGLILHEVIYEDLIKNGASDSVDARYLTALISSRELESKSVQDYVQGVLNRLRVSSDYKVIRFGQARFFTSDIQFYPDGSVEYGRMAGAALIASAGQQLPLNQATLSFYRNGHLRSVRDSKAGIQLTVNGTALLAYGDLFFHENGAIHYLNSENFNVQFEVQGQKLWFGGAVSLRPDGQVYAALLRQTASLLSASGETKEFKGGSSLLFDELGRVVEAREYEYGGWICFDRDPELFTDLEGVLLGGAMIMDPQTGQVNSGSSLKYFRISSGVRTTVEERKVTSESTNSESIAFYDGKNWLSVGFRTDERTGSKKDFQPGMLYSPGEKPMFCRTPLPEERF